MRSFVIVSVCLTLFSDVLAIKRIVGESGGIELDVSEILMASKSIGQSSIISSGFISTLYDVNTPFTVHVKKRINRPGICNKIELINTPNPNHSPLMGKNIFTLNPDEFFNDHYSYSNGKEVLSYVQSDEENGNWLIGVKPGVDSGYVVFRTFEAGFSPLNLENSEHSWNWLQKGKWEEFPDMKIVCVDPFYSNVASKDRHYFTIEYFDPETREAEHSVLIPDFNPFILSRQDGNTDTDEANYKVPAKFAKKKTNGSYAAYLNKRTNKWVLLHTIKTIAVMGGPLSVADTSIPEDRVSVLVKEEHAGNAGWRLSFKHTTNSFTKSNPYTQRKDEYLVELNTQGVLPPYSIAEMSSSVSDVWWSKVVHDVQSVQVGDYLWTWLAPLTGTAAHSETIFEALLKCVAVREEVTDEGVTEITALFEYYDSDRGEVLRGTILSRDTDLVKFKLNKQSSVVGGLKNAGLKITYKGKQHQLHSSIFIGSDIIGFIRNYLVDKEGHPHGMSSCYMYHAAVSMPQVLVYAAEIVCVLIGAKPLTMIQYTSSSETQWKFPLVRELSQAVVASKNLLGDGLDVQYEVFKYHNDESLIIYRTNRTWVADSLVPGPKQAQALHPLPYPDSSRLREDNKLQIYNAAWNGLLLGYPEYFVESYCETFHNPLEVAEKKRQFRAGKKDFEKHLSSIKKDKFLIKMGLEKPIAEDHFDMIASSVIH